MKRYFKTVSTLMMAIVLITLAGCGKKEAAVEENKASLKVVKEASVSEVVEETPKAEEVKEEPKEEHKEKEVRSLLTGEIIDKKLEGKRPYAFMFSNIKFAYPQSGTSQAGIIYEILAEGGITRLMGVLDSIKGDRIGSARSARHYYVDFAKEFDAFFIHFGQTKYAIAEMKKLNMDTLSGLSWEGSIVFYRDKKLKAPHNAFATGEGIQKAIKKKKYRKKLADGIGSHFNFSYEEEVNHTGTDSFDAGYVKIPFSGYMTPSFTYENGLYTRYAFGEKHIDKVNKEALTFKNILIQFVNEYDIDRNGYQTMDLISASGEGYYITNGKGIKVYWKKSDETSKTKFYYDKEFKNEISVNVGKTYYAVAPTTISQKISFKK